MRYRKLDAQGDHVFGHGQADFYRDQAEAVGQAVKTRLGLYTGEWFLDLAEGTPWRTQVLGKYTQNTYDTMLKDRVLSTQGVMSLDSYSSTSDSRARALSVAASISTIYGTTPVEATL